MDSFRESWLQKDLFCFVIDKSDFIDRKSWFASPNLKDLDDSICDLNYKDSTCFHESNKSLLILTNP